MNALGLFAYLLGCVVVGGLLTLVLAMFRSVKKHDDFRSWRWMAGFSAVVALAPYGYAEVMTHKHGSEMATAVESVLKTAKVKGKVSYFKVLKAETATAELIVVASEKTTMSDHESCVMKVALVRDKKNRWIPDEFEFIDSFERGKDAVTMPPYW